MTERERYAAQCQRRAAQAHERASALRDVRMLRGYVEAAEDRAWFFLLGWWKRFGESEPEAWA
jgi:hypothetical protein